jgi:hypothetical protein
MKTIITLAMFCVAITFATAQTITSLQIDGKAVTLKKSSAGIEKVMDNHRVAISLEDDVMNVSLNFNYKSIEGKTSAVIISGTNTQDLGEGFELIYKPASNKPGMWNIFNNATSKGKITITGFSEAKKEISGTFEAVVQEMMDEKGSFVAGKSTKTVTVKGEFKNLPFIKVN